MTGFTQPKNLFIGNYSLRGNNVHDMRFEAVNLSPSVSTKNTKGMTLAWNDDGKDKTMDFSLKYYCKNGNYNPGFEYIAPNMDLGSKSPSSDLRCRHRV